MALENLAAGNELRVKRASHLRKIRAGQMSLASALVTPELATLNVRSLLENLPSRQTTNRRNLRRNHHNVILAVALLRTANVSDIARVGNLTLRQRHKLTSAYRVHQA